MFGLAHCFLPRFDPYEDSRGQHWTDFLWRLPMPPSVFSVWEVWGHLTVHTDSGSFLHPGDGVVVFRLDFSVPPRRICGHQKPHTERYTVTSGVYRPPHAKVDFLLPTCYYLHWIGKIITNSGKFIYCAFFRGVFRCPLIWVKCPKKRSIFCRLCRTSQNHLTELKMDGIIRLTFA